MQICPGCGQTTPLFPPAPEHDSIWGLVPRLASIPFSYQAALDADEGRPVMITGAVPEQVAAYQLIAKPSARSEHADIALAAGWLNLALCGLFVILAVRSFVQARRAGV